MDWTDHIIATRDCRSAAAAFIPFGGEDFLITLANKGLYKRALKDIEVTQKIEITLAGDMVQVTLDNETVLLRPNVAESSCSCPSKTVCKHVLMAILSAVAWAGKETDTPEESQSVNLPADEGWKELNEADSTQLRKQAGKKLFDDTLRLIQDGWTAEFTEGEVLQAVINTEQITVYFPREQSISHAICKCGASGLCKHKLIAILSWLSRQGTLTGQTGEGEGISFLTDELIRMLEEGLQFITNLLAKGMINAGENEIENAIRYSIRMEAAGIGNLARLFRTLATDIENLVGKHVGFDQIKTFHTETRIYNTIRLILQHRDNNKLVSELIESTRSDYYTTPLGHFTGLGAVPWQTRSGYFGVTVYLFYHEKQTICTYTVSMADYYTNTESLATLGNVSQQFQRNAHWQENLSLATLSQSLFTLRNFKLNKQNRLSSSVQTQCEITGKTDQTIVSTADCLEQLFTVPEALTEPYTYFSKKEAEKIILFHFDQVTNISFDRIHQRLHFTLLKEDQPVTDTSILYNPFHTEAIKRIERMQGAEKRLRQMVCLRNRNSIQPVAIIGSGGVDNFFFEL